MLIVVELDQLVDHLQIMIADIYLSLRLIAQISTPLQALKQNILLVFLIQYLQLTIIKQMQ